mmetsp:Transcript_8560/g.24039  ORF Transcript_8560/g.24039 Transcript_8560/m.24039 type:complete len:303 (+) Transcript_8560:57-965(+)
MRPVGSAPLFWLLALARAGAQSIDPNIYAKIFEVNQPAWRKMADLVQANIPEGSWVLDIGTGPGEPSSTMARRMPKHSFVLTDKQEPMVEKARKRTEGLSNVVAHVMPAEDFSLFADESFDAATACYVLMFSDQVKALKELHRVLKPGGLAFVSVWKEMPFYTLPRQALSKMYARFGFTGTPPTFSINPLSLSPTEYGTSSVEDGVSAVPGLTVKASEILSYDFNLGTMQDICAATTVLGFPFAKVAEENGKTEAQLKEAYCALLEEAISDHQDWRKPDGSFHAGTGIATIYTLQKTDKMEL